ncbi:MAG: hypothetical protein JRN67_02375, partial [Nitrososphaerota archaeon]|nr:hypothetical protein [Nitrososphaerota archaeon]
CANDRIVDEYEDAVKILFDLQDIDFQIFHLIFDTYEGVGNREDRKKSENDLIAAWRMKEAEVMSRIKNVRNCYVGVFQEPPQGIQVSQIS